MEGALNERQYTAGIEYGQRIATGIAGRIAESRERAAGTDREIAAAIDRGTGQERPLADHALSTDERLRANEDRARADEETARRANTEAERCQWAAESADREFAAQQEFNRAHLESLIQYAESRGVALYESDRQLEEIRRNQDRLSELQREVVYQNELRSHGMGDREKREGSIDESMKLRDRLDQQTDNFRDDVGARRDLNTHKIVVSNDLKTPLDTYETQQRLDRLAELDKIESQLDRSFEARKDLRGYNRTGAQHAERGVIVTPRSDRDIAHAQQHMQDKSAIRTEREGIRRELAQSNRIRGERDAVRTTSVQQLRSSNKELLVAKISSLEDKIGALKASNAQKDAQISKLSQKVASLEKSQSQSQAKSAEKAQQKEPPPPPPPQQERGR